MSKSNKEKNANLLYQTILKKIIVPLTGDKTTFLDELNGVGHKLLGVKFKGVFPADKIPRLNDLKKYAILNLDTSKEPGSHWVSIAKDGKETYLYDSFGRSHTKIIKGLQYSGNGRIVNTDLDAEQDVLETNCGARCLAWLVLFDNWGADVAILI
jgi:hypothetical protein